MAPPKRGKIEKKIFPVGQPPTLAPPPPTTLTFGIYSAIITSKYTLKCPKLNYFLKIIFRGAYPGNPLDYLKTDTLMFEHGFLPVIKQHLISHPPPPPPIG